MRKIFNLVLLVTGVTFFLASCDKKNDLPLYGAGKAITLSSDKSAVVILSTDAAANVLKLNWTYPAYATDSSKMKYTIQIDSTGKNFANASTREVYGSLSADYLGKELNDILISRGYAFNVPVDMDVRVISSYNNNNERITSNTLKIRMTPYKTPPKVPIPTSNKLFIVGSATGSGWNNPVSTPSQEFTKIDETTYGGIFQLTGGQEYLLLPVNGDWGHKFGVPNNALAGVSGGGDFMYDGTAQNVPSPSASGLYKIIVDFQTGKFTVTSFTQQHGLPTELYIVGDATPGGWNNPVPVPSQKFTRLTSTVFEIASLALNPGKNYLFLPTNGDWSRKFGAVDNSLPGIKLGAFFKPEGGDMPSPDLVGNYKITVDFLYNTYRLVKL